MKPELRLIIVEDNEKLRRALQVGLEAAGSVRAVYDCASGEEALSYCLKTTAEADGQLVGTPPAESQPVGAVRLPVDVFLMDVQLAGEMNGIQAVVAIRREFPRMPAVFYSIQDDDAYYRDFRHSGILSHYAYVRKSNYLLPQMILPLLLDATAGRNFIDPEIEARLQEVRYKDEQSPMALLEPNEQAVARLLAQGLTNEQIAARMGFRDRRTISRVNGQIYAAWNLNTGPIDEKIARTRAALIVQAGRLISWDAAGNPYVIGERGEEIAWE